jgi:hypothetical protein
MPRRNPPLADPPHVAIAAAFGRSHPAYRALEHGSGLNGLALIVGRGAAMPSSTQRFVILRSPERREGGGRCCVGVNVSRPPLVMLRSPERSEGSIPGAAGLSPAPPTRECGYSTHRHSELAKNPPAQPVSWARDTKAHINNRVMGRALSERRLRVRHRQPITHYLYWCHK